MGKTDVLEIRLQKLRKKKEDLKKKIPEVKENGKITKKISEYSTRLSIILEKEQELSKAYQKMEYSLARQREYASAIFYREETGYFAKSNHLTNGFLRKFSSLQSALSQNEDRIIIKNRFLYGKDEEKILLNAIVIHPELIQDELMEGLGLADEAYRKLEYHEKLTIKIDAIPRLKKMISESQSLITGSDDDEQTGRIALIKDRNEKGHGKILLVQNNENPLDDEIGRRRKYIAVHDNAYSFLKSQKETLTKLKEKSKKLSNASVSLGRLRFAQDDKTRKKEYSALVAILSRSESGFIKKALKALSEAEAVGFIGTEDKLDEAKNFILKKSRELASQITTIENHSRNISIALKNLEVDFSLFRSSFRQSLSKLDQAELGEIIEFYRGLNEEEKKSAKGDCNSLILKTKEELSHILGVDYEEEAKVQAYYWYLQDEGSSKVTDAPGYHTHQYFEAERQKKDFYRDLQQKLEEKLVGIERLGSILENKKTDKAIREIIRSLKEFNRKEAFFCVRPFTRFHDIFRFEEHKLLQAFERLDQIGVFRRLLSLHIIIKCLMVATFLDKIGASDIDKIISNEQTKQSLNYRINRMIGIINEKNFLRDIEFSEDSKINRFFRSANEILAAMQKKINENDSEGVKALIKARGRVLSDIIL